jgi:hypothetical protein
MGNISIEQKLTREKFEEIMRGSQANHIANASKEELDGLYESFVKLVKILEEKEPINSSSEILDENEKENEDLSKCEQCGEKAWDGYICHYCGLKII